MKEEILRAIKTLEKMKKYYSSTNNHPHHWGFNFNEAQSFNMAVNALQQQLDRSEHTNYIEWEKESDYYNCSYCKNSFDMDEDNLFDFCPRCGRKLRGGEDE